MQYDTLATEILDFDYGRFDMLYGYRRKRGVFPTESLAALWVKD
jgi:hypothetical protein